MASTLLAPNLHKGVSYRPDIDGLRTVAVLAVVLYHASIGPFSGGFVGVDVFFVISGFLIMSTLASDLAAGRFSILTFYERRIRRIFPALFAMMAVVTAVAALVVLPAQFADHGKSLIAAATSLSNVYFYMASGTAGYFDNGSETRLLLHTWSLSVEEQFYVLLPVALLLLRGRGRRALVVALSLFAVGSFALSLLAVAYRPMDAFYLVLPRAWELLAGCLLAVCDVPALPRRWMREAAAALGLALVAFAVFGYDKHTAFPGAGALLPVAGALLLIHAGKAAAASGGSLVGRVLSSAPSVYIGRISYSLYLWHWPIIVFVGQIALVKSLDSGELTARAKILILVASFAAAILSYHLVEQPFRRKGMVTRFLTRPRLVGGGVATALLAACCGLVIVAGAGLPARFDQSTTAGKIMAANLQRAYDQPDENCYHYKEHLSNVAEFEKCRSDSRKAHNVLVLGDSHAGSLRPLVQSLVDDGSLGDRGMVSAIAAGCLLNERMNNRSAGHHCATTSKLAFARAMQPDVDLVLLAFSAWWTVEDGILCTTDTTQCEKVLASDEAQAIFLMDLKAKVRAMKAAGKVVILQLPMPVYNKPIPSLELTKVTYGFAKQLSDKFSIALPLQRFDFVPLRRKLEAIAASEDAIVFDPRTVFCNGDRCVYQEDSVSIYIDDNHVANSRIGLLKEPLEKAFAVALPDARSVLTARRTSGAGTSVASTSAR